MIVETTKINITPETLAGLGSGRIAYIRPVNPVEARSLFPQMPKVAPDLELWALLGADGLVYVADRGIGVLRFDAVTGAFVDVFVPNGRGGLDRPWRLAFGPDGRIYVTSAGTQDVRRS